MIAKILLLSCFTSSVLSKYNFKYKTYLDTDQRFYLKWNIDYDRDLIIFLLRVHVNPHGQWFAFGFSDYGGLNNADFVAIWINKEGVRYFQDVNTDSHGILHVDRHQDYRLVDAWSREGSDTVVFYRKFDTCHGDYVIDRGTTHLLYLLGDGHLNNIEGVNASKVESGLQRVQLIKPQVPIPSLPVDSWTFDIVAPQITIPSKDTTYWWYITKLPHLPVKRHIIKYEGIIDNSDIVHHMEVFHCEVSDRDRVPYFNGPGLREGKPKELKSCRNVIGAWAMGAGPVFYPSEAGTAIGGPGVSRYVLLEVHYNNPTLISGRIDRSGIRFTVTKTLRKYDAGIMELGLEYSNNMAIPPGQSTFPLTGYCVAECTTIGLPPRGIWVFASQLHTHLTGRRVYTKHVRDGTELPDLNRDDHYSPHFQEIRLLPHQVHVLPGDALYNTCEDRTVGRKRVTVGGFAITDEMCVNYVHYYPKVDLEVCKSSIQTHSLNNFFRFMRRWEKEETSVTKGDRENYDSISWTPLNVYLLRKLYETSPLSVQCNRSSGQRFPGHWEGILPTKILYPLEESRETCRKDLH